MKLSVIRDDSFLQADTAPTKNATSCCNKIDTSDLESVLFMALLVR